jgi:hypothetical protein
MPARHVSLLYSLSNSQLTQQLQREASAARELSPPQAAEVAGFTAAIIRYY